MYFSHPDCASLTWAGDGWTNGYFSTPTSIISNCCCLVTGSNRAPLSWCKGDPHVQILPSQCGEHWGGSATFTEVLPSLPGPTTPTGIENGELAGCGGVFSQGSGWMETDCSNITFSSLVFRHYSPFHNLHPQDRESPFPHQERWERKGWYNRRRLQLSSHGALRGMGAKIGGGCQGSIGAEEDFPLEGVNKSRDLRLLGPDQSPLKWMENIHHLQ